MDKNKDKKQTYVLRVLMMISTVVLIILFFATMSMVGKIQGTARVVNYAGLVRGKTQRIIKMEDAGQEEDAMIDDVAAFIDGLRNGSDSLNLVRLDDYAFQSKMEELDDYFQSLEQEIYLVREKGYENSEIIAKSEQFFQICDEATGLAEGGLFAEKSICPEHSGKDCYGGYRDSDRDSWHRTFQGSEVCRPEPDFTEKGLSG